MNFSGKKVAILGGARSGIACANLLESLGAKVFLSEIRQKDEIKELKKLNKNIQTEFGEHSKEILNSDLVIPSPGVPLNLPVLEETKKRNIPIFSELEIAYRLINPKQVIAITGTNGKSTTVTLLGEIFRQAKEKKALTSKVIVAGNIGYPLSAAVKKINSDTVLILEVSSYQLELIEKFRPHIAVILNLTPDHLERHQSLENYAKIKARIYENQNKDDFCIFNADDHYCKELAKDCPSQSIFFSRQKKLTEGVFFNGKKIVVNLSTYLPRRQAGQPINLSPALKIPGPHNLENVLVAVAVAVIAKIPEAIILRTINSFPGLEHRLEFVREVKGIKFINDSKATNPDSVLVALKSFNKKLILIMGGRDKGLPYTPLIPLIKEKVKALLLIGEAEEKIAYELQGTTQIIPCGTLKKAVKEAYRITRKGEIVLLSPACASFDQFRDFEQRGKIFKNLVKKL